MKKIFISLLLIFALIFTFIHITIAPLGILIQRFFVQFLDSDNQYPCMQHGWVQPLNPASLNLYSQEQIKILLTQTQSDLTYCQKILRADQVIKSNYLVNSDLQQIQQAQINIQQLSTALTTAQNNSSVNWVLPQASSAVPIFNAGDAQTPLYICQAKFQGNLYPGQYSAEGCIVTYAGASYLIKSYYLLSVRAATRWIDNISWQTTGANYTAIVGGYENYHDIPICRASVDNILHIGKVVANICDVRVGAKEVSVPNFEVLTYQP